VPTIPKLGIKRTTTTESMASVAEPPAEVTSTPAADTANKVIRVPTVPKLPTLTAKKAASDAPAQSAIAEANVAATPAEPRNADNAWKKCKDDNGFVYYFNDVTQQSQWDRPATFQE